MTADGGPPRLRLEDVVKDYRGLRPLRIARLEIRAGARVALSGVDAAGAEVLVNLITGAGLPDRGTVWVDGVDTTSISDGDAWLASLDRFGIVSERAVMLDGSSLIQNISLPLSLEIDAITPETKRRVEGLAAAVGLASERLNTRAADAPSADRLRAQVARALALDPSLLLLEHPTVSLARGEVAAFARDMASIAERRTLTVLAITEDGEFAKRFASQWLKVNPGTGEVRRAGSRWWTA
jgi:ABC-type lipoprotein export system ATPase subunit